MTLLRDTELGSGENWTWTQKTWVYNSVLLFFSQWCDLEYVILHLWTYFILCRWESWYKAHGCTMRVLWVKDPLVVLNPFSMWALCLALQSTRWHQSPCDLASDCPYPSWQVFCLFVFLFVFLCVFKKLFFFFFFFTILSFNFSRTSEDIFSWLKLPPKILWSFNLLNAYFSRLKTRKARGLRPRTPLGQQLDNRTIYQRGQCPNRKHQPFISMERG